MKTVQRLSRMFPRLFERFSSFSEIFQRISKIPDYFRLCPKITEDGAKVGRAFLSIFRNFLETVWNFRSFLLNIRRCFDYARITFQAQFTIPISYCARPWQTLWSNREYDPWDIAEYATASSFMGFHASRHGIKWVSLFHHFRFTNTSHLNIMGYISPNRPLFTPQRKL